MAPLNVRGRWSMHVPNPNLLPRSSYPAFGPAEKSNFCLQVLRTDWVGYKACGRKAGHTGRHGDWNGPKRRRILWPMPITEAVYHRLHSGMSHEDFEIFVNGTHHTTP